jgi:hypothetical protein
MLFNVVALEHSKLKVCFASEKYSKATLPPGNKTHTEKLHKMFTSGDVSNLEHRGTCHWWHQYFVKKYGYRQYLGYDFVCFLRICVKSYPHGDAKHTFNLLWPYALSCMSVKGSNCFTVIGSLTSKASNHCQADLWYTCNVVWMIHVIRLTD